MNKLLLKGCASRPLASYLKALGILRLVAEQADPDARGAWRNGEFFLVSRLDENALRDFFLSKYAPTPLVTPWNGGSGFYSGDNTSGLEAIRQSKDSRFAVYRNVINQILGWAEFKSLATLSGADAKNRSKEIKKKSKNILLQRCRACLPEICLQWLDAAYTLNEGNAVYAPLLGTGGNEGRLEYANNFMQRTSSLLLETAPDRQTYWLNSALFDTPSHTLPYVKVGQFDPGNAGGANQGMGTACDDVKSNPWDFILMLEGTLLFAASLVRRSPVDQAQASFPFCVKGVLAAGYTSARLKDNGRAELWMPLWSNPAGVNELRRLLSEGRATLDRGQVKDGLDFARAVSSLGVDRSISCFERYSLLERRGQSYVALPVGRMEVSYRPEVASLAAVAAFLKVRIIPKETPESLVRAQRGLARAVFDCTQKPDSAAFIAVSRALARLDALPNLSGLIAKPCPPLPPEWICLCDDGSPEVRIAAAVASLARDGLLGSFRTHLAMVKYDNHGLWAENSRLYVPWRGGVIEGLGRLLMRRLLEAQRLGADPWKAEVLLDPADLMPLLEGRVDTALLADLIRAFSLVKFSPKSRPANWKMPLQEMKMPYAVAVLKLLHNVWPQSCHLTGIDRTKLRLESRMAALIAAGRINEACACAGQRLRIAGATQLYLPSDFSEAVYGINPMNLLACLSVPVCLKSLAGKHLGMTLKPIKESS